MFYIFLFTTIFIFSNCAPIIKHRVLPDSFSHTYDTPTCFFTTPQSSNLETAKRLHQFQVSPNHGGALIRMTELIEAEEDNLFGAGNPLELILYRGAGECFIDFTNVDTVNLLRNQHICESHISELLTEWDAVRFHHIRKKKEGGHRVDACSFPNTIIHAHDKVVKAKYKTYNSLTVGESVSILIKYGTLVSPGIPMCDKHKKLVKAIHMEHTTCAKDACYEEVENDGENDGENEDDNTDEIEDADDSDYLDPSKPTTCPNPIRKYFVQFSRSAGFSRIIPRKKFDELSYTTQLKKASMTKKLVNLMIEEIAPANPFRLKQMVLSDDKEEIWLRSRDDDLSSLLKNVAFRYKTGVNRAERISVLSIVAKTFPLTQIQAYIPGLSRHLFDEARKRSNFDHNYLKRKRERYNPLAINTFIQFVTSNVVMLPNTFGMRKIKFSTGNVESLPDVIRKQSSSEIIRMYNLYLKETSQENIKLSDSTLYHILLRCSATKLSARQCVDYFLADLLEGESEIRNILEKMKTNSYITPEFFEDISAKLSEYVLYLRTDFMIHVKKESRIEDHCTTYALSDKTEPRLAQFCTHPHDIVCNRCESGKNTLGIIIATVEAEVNEAKKTLQRNKELVDFARSLRESVEKIEEYKKHILRSRATDMEKTNKLQNLENGDALLILDFAQKLLPQKHIEKQTDYFGKTGMSWHVTHVTANISNGLKTHNFIHIIKEKQNSAAVVAILNHTLIELKKNGIQRVFLRSDNAGNYHCETTISSMMKLSETTDVKVLEYSFSEVQNGKDSCDRIAAVAKKKIHSFVDAGGDVTNEDQFFHALTDKNPIQATTVCILSIEKPEECQKKKKSGFEKISKLYFFEYHEDKIVGKGYKEIGTGIVIKKEDIEDFQPKWSIIKTSIETVNGKDDKEKFWYTPNIKQDHIKQKETPTIHQSDTLEVEEPDSNVKLFSCPQLGCIKKYTSFGHLEHHLIKGNHIYHPERTTLIDHALHLYKLNIESVVKEQLFETGIMENLEKSIQKDHEALSQGWALRSRKKSGRFSQNVISELTRLFDEGIERGSKYSPEDVQKKMREERNADKTHKFTQEELLNTRQIASFFSRLSSKRESEKTSRTKRSPESENECEKEGDEEDMFSSDWELSFKYDNYYENIDSLMRKIIMENLNDFFENVDNPIVKQ